jgi:hypothetical protein
MLVVIMIALSTFWACVIKLGECFLREDPIKCDGLSSFPQMFAFLLFISVDIWSISIVVLVKCS